jgi:hypothetical protein
MWWVRHLWLVGIQVVAFVPYIIGSSRFYRRKSGFMRWLAIGIALDVIMAITPFIVKLPRMEASQGAPWSSILFLTHIILAGAGMFGFVIMFFYLAIKGYDRDYPRLRKFQYVVLLRLWMAGVGIALVNFAVKVMFGVRVYDLL